MDNPIFIIANTIVAGLLVLAGYGISFLQQKWKQKQVRTDTFLEKRMKVYGEGLEFVYEVEMNRTKDEELGRILERWKKWYPSNVVSLPPSVNNALFGAMHWTIPIIIDLHNKTGNKETWDKFNEELQNAKTSLMNLMEIGWLPEDLQ